MSTKTDYTPDEWNQLLKVPMMAALSVVAASPSGPFGVLKELFAVGKLITETKADPAAAGLIQALSSDLGTREALERAQPTELRGMTPEQAKKHALENIRQVAALVGRKTARAESEAFKRWVVTVTTRVAEAAKEGGFLGFGGTQVSEQETAAIKDVSAALARRDQLAWRLARGPLTRVWPSRKEGRIPC